MPIANTERGSRRYQITGSGHPLLMLLPKSTGPFGVKNLIHNLASRFLVLTYDANNKYSDYIVAESQDISIEGFAEDAAAFLTTIGKNEVVLCCHSTGCGIGLALAGRFPELIKSLVLINPWLWPDEYLISVQNMRIKMAELLDPVNYSKFNSSLLFPPFYRRKYHAEFEKLAIEARLNPHNPVEIKRRLNAILNYDARPIIHKIKCPTLILSAHDDQLMPRWFSEDLASQIQQNDLLIFEEGGHMLPETCDRIVAKELSNFFQ